ncbi:MAG: hypothetical protein HQL03_13960 [Nitrospirae bacterium]|nr:hypothetical protein [Nitrospirota bacterium]
MSFAIDFTSESGVPEQKTKIAKIRLKAKPYESPVSESHYVAAKELAKKAIEFIKKARFYDNLDSIIGMPPSDPDKKFILAHILSKEIAQSVNLEDLSHLVSKLRKTSEAKELPVTEKLDAIKGSISVSDGIKDKKILLVDDLYQSGVSTNYVAMLLLNAGAQRVFGLACEKTCRNDDNTSSKSC